MKRFIKTINSCVDAADFVEALEENEIWYEYGDNGVYVKAYDFDNAEAILMKMEEE